MRTGCYPCGFSTAGTCNCMESYCDFYWFQKTSGYCYGYPGCSCLSLRLLLHPCPAMKACSWVTKFRQLLNT